MDNYKGIYYHDSKEQRFYEGGAHFKYSALFKVLLAIGGLLSNDENEYSQICKFKKDDQIKSNKDIDSLLRKVEGKKSKYKTRNIISFDYLNNPNTQIKLDSHKSILHKTAFLTKKDFSSRNIKNDNSFLFDKNNLNTDKNISSLSINNLNNNNNMSKNLVNILLNKKENVFKKVEEKTNKYNILNFTKYIHHRNKSEFYENRNNSTAKNNNSISKNNILNSIRKIVIVNESCNKNIDEKMPINKSSIKSSINNYCNDNNKETSAIKGDDKGSNNNNNNNINNINNNDVNNNNNNNNNINNNDNNNNINNDNIIIIINNNNNNNNNNKTKFLISKKRGRKKTKKERNNHSKLAIDNLNNTIKIYFLNFIIDYINSLIYEDSQHQTVKFRYLDGKIATIKNKKFFKYFLRQNLKDILKIIPISERYKNCNIRINNNNLNKNRILSILKYELEKPIYEFYKLFISEEKKINNNKIKYLSDILKKKKENFKGKNSEQFINYLKYAANNFLNYYEVLDYSIDYFEDAGELKLENENIENNNSENDINSVVEIFSDFNSIIDNFYYFEHNNNNYNNNF